MYPTFWKVQNHSIYHSNIIAMIMVAVSCANSDLPTATDTKTSPHLLGTLSNILHVFSISQLPNPIENRVPVQP